MPDLAPLTGIEDLEEEKRVPIGKQKYTAVSAQYKDMETKEQGTIPTISFVLRLVDDEAAEFAPVYATLYLPHENMEMPDRIKATRDVKRVANAFGVDVSGDWDAKAQASEFKGMEATLRTYHKAREDGNIDAKVSWPSFGGAA